MTKYRKKPVVVEAFQLTAENFTRPELWPKWARKHYIQPDNFIGSDEESDDRPIWYAPSAGMLIISTLEGEMEAKIGDWIIKGVKGELYPCKDDIFRATYEPVEEGE